MKYYAPLLFLLFFACDDDAADNDPNCNSQIFLSDYASECVNTRSLSLSMETYREIDSLAVDLDNDAQDDLLLIMSHFNSVSGLLKEELSIQRLNPDLSIAHTILTDTIIDFERGANDFGPCHFSINKSRYEPSSEDVILEEVPYLQALATKFASLDDINFEPANFPASASSTVLWSFSYSEIDTYNCGNTNTRFGEWGDSGVGYLAFRLDGEVTQFGYLEIDYSKTAASALSVGLVD